MFQISSSKDAARLPFSFHPSLPILAFVVLSPFGLAPNAVAQAVSEVIITGNPLAKSQNVNNVSSLSGIELTQQGQSTLGETLNNLPGVSSTYFGPNASRPIVRGLDGDRIRVLSNSGASLDVSSLSYDHAVPLDVLSTERIEVLRGPAALQYGGSAIGGVVNVIDNRIPRKPMEGVLGKVQLQGASGNQEVSKGALLETGFGPWVLHADAFDRRSKDVKVPQGVRCEKPGSPSFGKRICNSANEANGGALGASLFFDQGFMGLSLQTYKSHYGTVAEDDVTIGMKSERAALEGEWRPQGGLVKSVEWQVSQTRYQHTEYDAGEAGTLFANKGHDGRIQLKHKPWTSGAGTWEGVWGLQTEQGRFSADGAEAFAPFSQTRTQALFAIEEYTLGKASFNVGMRREQISVQSLGSPNASSDFELGTRKFSPQSYALSSSWQWLPQWRLSANASRTERAPKDYELFAEGLHIATAAWERGQSGLGLEKANSLDLTAQWQQDAHQMKLTAFQSRFSNFIGLLATGEEKEVDGETFPVLMYSGVRAKFSGFEASGQWRLMQSAGTLDLTWRADAVRAQNLSTGEALPRISPLRFGSSLVHASGPWNSHLGFDWHAVQNRVPEPRGDAIKGATSAFTLWHAHVGYKQKVSGGVLNWFTRIDNLSNQWAYSATSILTTTAAGKAPLPGRSVKLGVLAAF
jgi:iron complex outermembrane receptor protein